MHSIVATGAPRGWQTLSLKITLLLPFTLYYHSLPLYHYHFHSLRRHSVLDFLFHILLPLHISQLLTLLLPSFVFFTFTSAFSTNSISHIIVFFATVTSSVSQTVSTILIYFVITRLLLIYNTLFVSVLPTIPLFPSQYLHLPTPSTSYTPTRKLLSLITHSLYIIDRTLALTHWQARKGCMGWWKGRFTQISPCSEILTPSVLTSSCPCFRRETFTSRDGKLGLKFWTWDFPFLQPLSCSLLFYFFLFFYLVLISSFPFRLILKLIFSFSLRLSRSQLLYYFYLAFLNYPFLFLPFPYCFPLSLLPFTVFFLSPFLFSLSFHFSLPYFSHTNIHFIAKVLPVNQNDQK